MSSFTKGLLQIPVELIAAILFILILCFNLLGHRFRRRTLRLNPDKEISLGASEAALLSLMALLLAFSFGMATTNFESKRQLVLDEANILSSAILRCDLYPDSIKNGLLPDFKHYLESRISYYDAGDDTTEINMALEDGRKHFTSIWNKITLLEKDPDQHSHAEQMVPIVIDMRNIATRREAGRLFPFPFLISMILVLLVLISSFLVGYGNKSANRTPLLSLAFTLMTTAVLYLVMELGRPKQGYINLNSAEQKIEELRNLFP